MDDVHFQSEAPVETPMAIADVPATEPPKATPTKPTTEPAPAAVTDEPAAEGTTKLQTPAMLRPSHGHRRSPSAPASLPSAAQLFGIGGAPKTPGSSTRGAATAGVDEQLCVQLTRVDGSFGLTMNNFNRVTAIKPQSAATFGGVRLFDRITHVDGVALEGKMSAAVAGRAEVELTIERPPCGLYGAIAIKENSPSATSPLALRSSGLSALLGGLPSSPLKEERIDAQSPAVVRAMEALAEAADAEPTPPPQEAGAARPAEAEATVELSPSPDAPRATPTARAGGGHRRSASQPTPLSAAAIAALQADDAFWGELPAGWALGNFTATPTADGAAANSAAETSPSSPRSVTASPTPSSRKAGRNAAAARDEASGLLSPGRKKAASVTEGSGGLRDWWKRRSSKSDKADAKREREIKRDQKELRKEESKLREPMGTPIAVPVMSFEIDSSCVDEDGIEVC